MSVARDPGVGDLARLKSGGLLMQRAAGAGGPACDRFGDGRGLNARFPAETLVGVTPGDNASEERMQ